MKIKRANKLPTEQGMYFYMLDGALRLVEVWRYFPGDFSENSGFYWRLVDPMSGDQKIIGGDVKDTSPLHWSDVIEFES